MAEWRSASAWMSSASARFAAGRTVKYEVWSYVVLALR
jgi:hypothetical protein